MGVPVFEPDLLWVRTFAEKTGAEQKRGHVTLSKPIARFPPHRREVFNSSLLRPLCLRCSAQENRSNLRTNRLKSVRMRCRARSEQTVSLAVVRRFEITRYWIVPRHSVII
uniref:Uncharacterized protein n=1 Tax=Timema genevievae TaxID=629358 RepID=A0A7R9K390_TIMGE|nr:unnamed protein product [Timema genevievae]